MDAIEKTAATLADGGFTWVRSGVRVPVEFTIELDALRERRANVAAMVPVSRERGGEDFRDRMVELGERVAV